MRAGLTKSAIAAYAELLRREGADDSAASLEKLSKIFFGFATRPMAEMAKFVASLDLVQSKQGDEKSEAGSIGALVHDLQGLHQLMRTISTKQRRNDLGSLIDALEPHESHSVRHLIETAQVTRAKRKREKSMVSPDNLALELEAALGYSETFDPLYEQLSKLRPKEIAIVADAFLRGGSARSAKKDLQRIRERHQSLLAGKAKDRAMAGRTAA